MGSKIMMVGLCLIMSMLILGTDLDAKISEREIGHLQRILSRGCGASLVIDGRWGPQTSRAYLSARQNLGFEVTDESESPEEIRAFCEQIEIRKRALILLHQFGHLRHRNHILSEADLVQTLEDVRNRTDIKTRLELSSRGLDRLTRWYFQNPNPGTLAEAMQREGVPFEGLRIHLQAFKKENELEVYGFRDTGYVFLKTFHITSQTYGSAQLSGPKTIQGDGLVPEGCYRITWQNLWSSFYIGYPISYPLRADRIRREYWQAGNSSGGAIVLHGSNVTIGCIPIGNPGIEELYLLLNENRMPSIHIFPCRFDEKEKEALIAEQTERNPRLGEFWDSLRPIHDYFRTHHRIPEVSFDEQTGYYVMSDR